jgi:hypothetical protein
VAEEEGGVNLSGGWRLATGNWLLATGYWRLAIGDWQLQSLIIFSNFVS